MVEVVVVVVVADDVVAVDDNVVVVVVSGMVVGFWIVSWKVPIIFVKFFNITSKFFKSLLIFWSNLLKIF